MKDESILAHINRLVEEEHRLRQNAAATQHDTARLKELEVELDQ